MAPSLLARAGIVLPMDRVGVLAIQGDFEKHLHALERCGAEAIAVSRVEQLAEVDRLIIPGGESTTVGLLLQRYGLGDAIASRGRQGMPIWGTCMGMILLAKRLADRAQYTLGLMDATVRRNAFGAQVASFEDDVEVTPLDEPFKAVFIRAPVIDEHGPDVEPLAEYGGRIVAARQGTLLATSFHPELTADLRLHKLFLHLK